MEEYVSCCGKSICQGCISSLNKSGNMGKCPYCNADKKMGKRDKEIVELLPTFPYIFDSFQSFYEQRSPF